MCFPAAGKNLFLLYLRAQAALILKRLCSSARFLRLICLSERGAAGCLLQGAKAAARMRM
jgi:hypothetical protein